MLVGTIVGVLVIPGLYYIFGKMADGKSLIPGQTDEPLTETLEHPVPDAVPLVVADPAPAALHP
jgi:hydrophobic/amphiphilic exporter-1 (mainly G- bacteria), HAE1 family